ncbi:MAG TPA: hypothetical protein VJ302_30250, partial [Blastocatellia bacterium]|nr:hypothetical protein [Blastocatellia bacterium]
PETGSDWLMGLAGAGIWAWLSKPMIWRQAAFAALLVAISVSATIFFFKRSQQPDGPLARRQDPSPSVETPTPAPASATPPVVTPAVTPAPKRSVPVPSAKPLTERELLDRQIVRAEREYRGAIRLLDRAIAKRQDQFDPELVKQYESSLALIDESIAASRRAFRERPGDLAAGQFLLAAYARKVELMQDLALR